MIVLVVMTFDDSDDGNSDRGRCVGRVIVVVVVVVVKISSSTIFVEEGTTTAPATITTTEISRSEEPRCEPVDG